MREIAKAPSTFIPAVQGVAVVPAVGRGADQLVTNRACADQLTKFNGPLPGRVRGCRNDPVTYPVTVADHAATRLGPPQVDAAVAICVRPVR
jgi:hypothetical protein